MEAAVLICPVCDIKMDAPSLSVTILSTPRGKQPWARCPGCRSFFAVQGYDAEKEVEHTRTQPWGMVGSGIAWTRDKAAMFEAILRAIGTYAPKGSPLLDVGCSYGGFLQRAQKAGYRVRGMDIVPEAVEYVRSLGIACDRAGSVGDAAVPESSQGIISVLDCNYYWPSQTRELRAIHSRLCPDGLLVMRVVDTSWAMQMGLWLGRCFPKAGRRLCEKAVYDHRVSIPVRSLLAVVQREGFGIVYTSQQDAMPFRHNSLKIRTVYAIGRIAWRIFGYNLAPGFVFIARKRSI